MLTLHPITLHPLTLHPLTLHPITLHQNEMATSNTLLLPYYYYLTTLPERDGNLEHRPAHQGGAPPQARSKVVR